MKRFALSVVLLFSVLCGHAQQASQRICFNNSGELKIAQFTDMHIGHDMEKNKIVEDMVKEVIETEKPDLIVFTGDNVVIDEVEQAWQTISAELAAYKVPWTAVLGNHDDEQAVKRGDIVDIIRKQPYCVMPPVAEGIKGVCNHILPVYGSSDSGKILALLYCIDSNSYATLPGIEGYGWIEQSQINWYAQESKRYTEKNGGQPLPALAFFHIPLPEYTQAWESFSTKRYGDRNEPECSPRLNSGMFARMLECGDVMGVFVGHDHDNDYVATFCKVALGYGRASGGRNTYGDKVPGSRIIVLKEGKREFDTWVREKGRSERLDFCTYPASFMVKK